MTAISAPRAHAARRASIAAAGIASAIGVHVLTMGGLEMMPVAPAMWAMLIALAAVLGTRRRAFVARGVAVTAALVVASQFALHAGMVVAPWAFGLQPHHAEPFLTPSSAAAHLAAAVVLVAAVAWGERLLAALVAAARSVLAPSARPPRSGVVARLIPMVRGVLPRTVLPGTAPSRGPPVPA